MPLSHTTKADLNNLTSLFKHLSVITKPYAQLIKMNDGQFDVMIHQNFSRAEISKAFSADISERFTKTQSDYELHKDLFISNLDDMLDKVTQPKSFASFILLLLSIDEIIDKYFSDSNNDSSSISDVINKSTASKEVKGAFITALNPFKETIEIIENDDKYDGIIVDKLTKWVDDHHFVLVSHDSDQNPIFNFDY